MESAMPGTLQTVMSAFGLAGATAEIGRILGMAGWSAGQRGNTTMRPAGEPVRRKVGTFLNAQQTGGE